MKPKVPIARISELEGKQASKQLEKRVPGSFTSPEYAEQAGLSSNAARVRLRALVNSGDLKRIRVPILTITGVVLMVPGYVLTEKYSKSS